MPTVRARPKENPWPDEAGSGGYRFTRDPAGRRLRRGEAGAARVAAEGRAPRPEQDCHVKRIDDTAAAEVSRAGALLQQDPSVVAHAVRHDQVQIEVPSKSPTATEVGESPAP